MMFPRLAVIILLAASLSGCTVGAASLAITAMTFTYHMFDDAVTVYAIETRPPVPPKEGNK